MGTIPSATSTPPATAPDRGHARSGPSAVSHARLLAIEVRDELRQLRREPSALFFGVAMPVGFYAVFVALFGGDADAGGVPVGTVMLATFGAYGALLVAMMNPAVGLAQDRESGWFQAVRVAPVPASTTLVARVVATLPHVAGILVAMTAVSAALGFLEITVGQWLALMVALVVGSQSFAFLGLAIGLVARPNAAIAILNAIVMPAAIASGLWFPLEAMPDWVATLAVWLPTYHLAELASASLEGGAWLVHLGVLVGFAAVTGAMATALWRRVQR